MTPDTLRWALDETLSADGHSAGLAPVHVPEGV